MSNGVIVMTGSGGLAPAIARRQVGPIGTPTTAARTAANRAHVKPCASPEDDTQDRGNLAYRQVSWTELIKSGYLPRRRCQGFCQRSRRPLTLADLYGTGAEVTAARRHPWTVRPLLVAASINWFHAALGPAWMPLQCGRAWPWTRRVSR
jgi:hypothetical protein